MSKGELKLGGTYSPSSESRSRINQERKNNQWLTQKIIDQLRLVEDQLKMPRVENNMQKIVAFNVA